MYKRQERSSPGEEQRAVDEEVTRRELVAKATGSLKECLGQESDATDSQSMTAEETDIRTRPWTEDGRTGITFLVPQIKLTECTPIRDDHKPDALQKLLEEAQVTPETVRQMANLSPGESDLLRRSPGEQIFDLQDGYDYEVDDCD